MELLDRLQRVSPGVVHDRDRMLREQLMENVRDVHLHWELKRRVERDPAVTFLDVRKVALMWAEEVEAAAPWKARACVAPCEVASYGVLKKYGTLQTTPG